MPDDEVRVFLEALTIEANKWRRLADDMGRVRADVARLELLPSAFFLSDMVSVAAHTAAYKSFQDRMVQLAGEAAAEFEEIGGALSTSADLYAASDRKAAEDMTRIYGREPQ